MLTETNIEVANSFLRGVKEGSIRGDVVQITVSENIALELSVSTFEFGKIHLRVMVCDARLNSPNEYNHFQQLFRIDDQYREFYDDIVSVIEAQNETNVKNAHSWEASEPNPNHPEIPDGFDVDEMVWFSEYVDLREELSMEEAIQTNRSG